MAYVTPSKVHARLEQFVGAWEAEVSLWSAPGAPAKTFTLKADSEMILGGRYLRLRLLGLIDGLLFEEQTVLGFDNGSGRFTRNLIHTFGTGTLVTTGDWAQPDRVIELRGETTNPLTGRAVKVRQRLTFESLDRIVIETFEQSADGTELRAQEQRLTRVAAR